jgi:transcription elongation factor GreB
MNKAFVKESDDGQDDDEDLHPSPDTPKNLKNYISPAGLARLKSELLQLLDTDRPEVVKLVSWAASNGDRSENGDYLYGKKRLREIDRRIRFLVKRIDAAEVVDASLNYGRETVFFGATVTILRESGEEQTITIVGIDEMDTQNGHVSWIAPISKALIKHAVGEEVILQTPLGPEPIEILAVSYPKPSSKA